MPPKLTLKDNKKLSIKIHVWFNILSSYINDIEMSK